VLKDAQQGNAGKKPRISLQQLKDAYKNEPNPWFKQMYAGLLWTAFACLSNDEYSQSKRDRRQHIGTIYRRFLVRLTKDCMMEGCSREPSDHEQAAALFGYHLHHINKGTRIASLLCNIEDMSEEAKKNCVVFCNLCHNHKEQEDVHSIPLSKLQNQLIYPTSNTHVSGIQVVIDFDLVVVILKLFVMGGWRTGVVHQCTPNALRSVFYDHFRILFDDTVDWDVDNVNMLNENDRRRRMNGAIRRALIKRCKCCAKCKMDFANVSSFHSTGIHGHHEGGKEFRLAAAADVSIIMLLTEIGRYISDICAFCHGIEHFGDTIDNT
jgi:hypothetical protein